MSQRGIVSIDNEKSGMAAIQLDDGSCTLVDLLGTEPVGVNDALEGELEVLGEETLLDKRSGRSIPVFIRAYQISLEAARDEMS